MEEDVKCGGLRSGKRTLNSGKYNTGAWHTGKEAALEEVPPSVCTHCHPNYRAFWTSVAASNNPSNLQAHPALQGDAADGQDVASALRRQ